MKQTTPRTAFEITHDAVRAVVRDGGAATRTHDPDDPRSLVDAIKGAARDAGASSGPCVVGVGRTSVVLKTIPLPPGGLAEHELPSFVRLQMDRQLPFPADRAAIDFVPAPHDPPALLAAALRSEELTRATRAVGEAGFRNASVALIDEGLARALPTESDGAAIGIFVTDERCEIVVARHGRLLMSRACDLEDGDTQGVVTEARRTLMSYRVRSDAAPVGAWSLVQDDADAVLREELETALGLGAPGEPRGQGDPAWALRLRTLFDLGDDRLDFASPTTPPDRNAKKRQLAMLAALVALALVGGWMTMGLRELRALDAEAETVDAELEQAESTAIGLIRAGARLDHAEAWLDSGADWNAHLDLIAGQLPGPDEMLIDRLDLRADSTVGYDGRRSRVYSADRWLADGRINIAITGRASSPGVARRVREALIDLDAYTLTPLGEDAGATGEGPYPVPIGAALSTRDLRPGRDDDGSVSDNGSASDAGEETDDG